MDITPGGIYLTFLNIEESAFFNDLKEVFSFIDTRKDPTEIDGTLQLICFLTPYKNKDQAIESFRRSGYSIYKDYNELICMQRKKEPKISLYFSLLEDGTLLILSNARKSDQIPERVHPIFDKEEDVYNLSVPPKYMIDMVGDLVGEKKRGIVTNFHGKYIPGTGKRSKIRPDITRNASYHGEDGYDTLKEWSHYYGIFPNIITLHFFNGLQVKLDSRGIFSIFKGKASDFLPILYPIIEYNQRIKKQIEKDSRYELIELKGSEGERTVGLEYPWNIRFDNVLAMSKYDSILKETSSMHKISYLSKIVNDDSRFLLADIIDDLKKVKMELRIKDNDIMIYPVERSDIGANLRMFDIISGNIDIRAEVR